MQTTSINGIDIAHCVDGSPDLPWLVLSNSLATDHRMWEPQMESLTQTHRVLRYDSRGHGQSQAPEGAYSFAMLVDDLVRLLDALKIETADVLGLSLGGMTALGLALDHPQRVNRLICCDARADAPAAYADGWHQRIAAVRKDNMSGVAEGTLQRWFTSAFHLDPKNASTLNLSRDMILTTSVDGFCGCASALTELNYASRLDEIRAPTLCVVGDQDSAATPNVMAAMTDAIPNARLKTIKDAAHLANMNNPNAFNRVIKEWWPVS
ncbi:MAG: alpha/beta fold hydrolase [Rhodospirillales bacterium]|jgi:3-oxoadipate enol-lactonase